MHLFFIVSRQEHTERDVRHINQLSIFARIVQDDFSCVEKMLDFVPLHDTTTGSDIYRALEITIQKFGCDLSKCSCIVTDGAKSMVGSKIGLFG